MLRWYCVIQVLDGLSSWTYFANQVAYFKALGRDTSIFSQRENNCDNKRRKMPCYNLHRRWNLSINVRDRDLLLVSLYLRFQLFRICIFLLFVILAGPHFAMSHLLIIMNLFCLISCQFQRIRNFHKIGSHFGTMTWADDMQQCDNNINQGI